MAGEGAKKRLEQNQGRLAALRIAILVTTALYIVMRLVIRASTRSGWHWFGLVVTLMAHGASYLAIAAAAQPTYSDTGALLDGGGDLNKGTASAYHDVLYVTCAVQAVSAFTNWGWWIYAAVPAYGGYMLWTSIIYPYFIKSKPNTEDTIDEKTRAKMERADRRAERRRMKRF